MKDNKLLINLGLENCTIDSEMKDNRHRVYCTRNESAEYRILINLICGKCQISTRYMHGEEQSVDLDAKLIEAIYSELKELKWLSEEE